LAVADSKAADHANIQVNKKASSKAAQRFKFVKVTGSMPSDGYYKIKSTNSYLLQIAKGSRKAGTKVDLGAKATKPYRKWYLSHSGNYVTLLSAPSYLALSTKGNSAADGAKVVQAAAKKRSGQKYRLVPADIDGTYYLQNAAGCFLSYGTNDKNGTAITVTKDINKAGAWRFERTTYADPGVKPGTYVDIDISSQKVRYVRNGKIIFATSCVTGNVAAGHSTPTGTFKVQSKTRNTILRGADYASPVKYWMPFAGGVGLHDANWRSSFGGSIYKTNGSHGCINMPPSVVPKLWKLVRVGTVVVVHK
jgi:lipoprotein-anchoring transpeptidase ErfK/SrfK